MNHLTTIHIFLSNNPNFNWETDNLARPTIADAQKWQDLEKETLLPELQTFQRLFRIYPQAEVAEALMEAGFHSAHQIAFSPQEAFTEQLMPILDRLGSVQNATALAQTLWENSRSISAQVNQLAMVALPKTNGLAVLKQETGANTFEADLPSWTELFGPQYFCECEECRSVWGAAAYFTDLMRLIDQYITQPSADSIPKGLSLSERRPDLWNMVLSCYNTNHEESYLTLANTIMGKKIASDIGMTVGLVLAIATYPFILPANLPEEEIRAYLRYFKLNLAEVYRRFWADEVQVARASLDLSVNEMNLLVRDSSQELETVYGLYPDEPAEQLLQTRLFLQKTGLNRQQLDTLIYQGIDRQSVSFGALKFDPATDSQKVSIPQSDVLNNALTGNQTILFWVKADAYGGLLIDKDYHNQFDIYIDKGLKGLSYRYGPGNDKDYQNFCISAGFTLGEWIHVAFVRDMDNKELKGYFNGRLSGDPVPLAYSTVGKGTSNFRFGRKGTENLSAAMAQISIWSRVLGQEEIHKAMQCGLPSDNSQLIGYWPLSEGEGTIAHDKSCNGYDGTLTNFPDLKSSWLTNINIPLKEQYQGKVPSLFFVNQLLPEDTYLDIVDRDIEQKQVSLIQARTGNGAYSIPGNDTFDRLQRFIRLAQSMKWNFVDLDWTLCSLKATDITENAIKSLALVNQLIAQFAMPVDEVVALFSDIKTIGRGQEPLSKTLFDRTFNQPQVFYSPDGAPATPYHPHYSGNPSFTSDILVWNAKPNSETTGTDQDAVIRTRLLAALQLKDADLSVLVEFLDTHALWSKEGIDAGIDQSANSVYLTVQNLSLLYRYSRLARALKMPLPRLIALLPALSGLSDTFLSTVNDIIAIVEQVKMVRTSGLSLAQLEYILNPDLKLPATLKEELDKLLTRAQEQLLSTASTVLLQPSDLCSDLISSTDAQEIFAYLKDQYFVTAEGAILNIRPLDQVKELDNEISSRVTSLQTNASGKYLADDLQNRLQGQESSLQKDVTQRKGRIIEVLAEKTAAQQKLVEQTLAQAFRADNHSTATALVLTERQLPSVLVFDHKQAQVIRVPWSSSLNPDSTTLSFWVCLHQLYDEDNRFIAQTFFTNKQDDMGFSVGIINDSGQVKLNVSFNGKDDKRNWAPEPNTWYHLVVSIGNPSNNTAELSIFINGRPFAKQGFDAAFHSVSEASDTGTYLASEQGLKNFMNGSLADVCIYSGIIRNEAQALAMMNTEGPLPEMKAQLGVWWPMHGWESIPTLYDWSGYANHGDISGVTMPVSDTYNPRLLLTNNTDAKTTAARRTLLHTIHQNLFWMVGLSLSPSETLRISQNPKPFGINSMRYGFRFRFSELMALSLYQRQNEQFRGTDKAYLNYLNMSANANDMSVDNKAAVDKRSALATLAAWDPIQLDQLINESPNANVSQDNLEARYDFNTVWGVQSLLDGFAVSDTLGTSINVPLALGMLSSQAVSADDSSWEQYISLSESIKNAPALHEKEEAAEQALAPICQNFEERKRDLLSSWLLWELGEDFEDLRTLDDLYEFLLIDVQTAGSVEISPLKLGLNSLQLYVQRCMNNLENGIVCNIPKAWWSWMSNYREWQVNREVYLYPENYVDPALRKLQSPLFSDLVTQVKQSPVTEESATQAYLNYLNGLKDIANLEIVDSCAWPTEPFPGSTDKPSYRRLALFGRTKSDPTTYYWRQAIVPYGVETDLDESQIAWSPWQALGVAINANYITPVRAFGKMFVFWVEQLQSASNYDGASYPYITATIYYAFQKTETEWSSPQTLVRDLVIKAMNQNGEAISYNNAPTLFGFDETSEYEKTKAWQKPQVWSLPASGSQASQLLITIGDYVVNGVSNASSGYSPLTREQKLNKQTLSDAYERAKEKAPNCTTIFPGFLLSSSLACREVHPSISPLKNTIAHPLVIESKKTGVSQFYLKNAKLTLPDLDIPFPYMFQRAGNPGLYNALFDQAATEHGNFSTVDLKGPGGSDIRAAAYDGKSNYLQISNTSQSKSILLSAFTFSCCFKLSEQNNSVYQAIFDMRKNDYNEGATLYVHTTNLSETALEFWSYDGGGRSCSLSRKLDYDAWYFVEIYCASKYQVISLYDEAFNLISSNRTTNNYRPSDSGTIRIGAGNSESATPGNYFSGYILEPTFWQGFPIYPAQRFYPGTSATLALDNLPAPPRYQSVQGQPGWFLWGDEYDHTSFIAVPQQYEAALQDTFEVNYAKDKNMVEITGTAANRTEERADPPLFKFTGLSTNTVELLLEKVFSGGLKELLQPASQYLPEIGLDQYQPTTSAVAPSTNLMDFNGSYGPYFWELFYHIPMYMAKQLQSDLRFKEAINWYNVIFDPTGSGRKLKGMTAFWPLTIESLSVGETGSYDTSDLQGNHSLTWSGGSTMPKGILPHTSNHFGPGRRYMDFTQGGFNGDPVVGQGEAFTVECWMALKDNMDSLQQRFIGQQTADNKSGWRITVWGPTSTFVNGAIQVVIVNSAGEHFNSGIGIPVPVFNWFHIAVAFDPVKQVITTFLNGEECSPPLKGYSIEYANGAAFGIGAIPGLNFTFKGYLANVVVWNHVRSQEQIRPDMAMLRYSDGRTPLSEQMYYLLFRPFGIPDIQTQYESLVNEPQQVLLYEYDPYDPNAIASQRPYAYKKAVVMQYIDNLIQYGDYLFGQNTWESINAATLCYITASNLLGRKPRAKAVENEEVDYTYRQLADGSPQGQVPQFLIDMEPEIPTIRSATSKDEVLELALAQRRSIINAYFCIPSNTALQTYRETVDDRLYKIRLGLNLGGQPNELALFEPPIDPESATQAAARGSDVSAVSSASQAIPHYRFSYLIQLAKNFASEVNQLGNALLSALEKEDAEYLAMLRETQGKTLLTMTKQMKVDQVNQLYAQQSSLQENLQATTLQQQTYQQWIDAGWNDWEIAQFATEGTGIGVSEVAAIMTFTSSPMYLFPVIFGLAAGGMNFGGSFEAIGRGLSEEGAILARVASLLAMKGNFERVNDEWKLQMQLAENNIKSTELQLQAIQFEINVALQNDKLNQTQIQQSDEVINFLQTKFTNHELYQWISGQLSTVYFQAYNAALNMAKMAETAYQYEINTGNHFISDSGWNSLYKGLLAGDALIQNLQQLEQAYVQGNRRPLEIEKTISLLQLAPEELLRLKDTGTCRFNLTEKLFDLDFPGHYCRKIAAISVTIPAVVGPYQNLHATLTQTSNQVLVSASEAGVKYLLGVEEQAPDTLWTNRNNNQAIAISTGTSDSGLFQLNFNDERYLPFEGTGAVSDWQLDLPKASNQFNFEAISDVIISLKYNAFDGGAAFREKVINISDGNTRPLQDYSATKFVSLRQYDNSAWVKFLNQQNSTVNLVRQLFPPNVTELGIDLSQVVVYPVLGADETYSDFQDQVSQLKLVAPESYNASDPFSDPKLALTLSAEISDDSDFLKDGKINPALWKDLILVFPYTATLDWTGSTKIAASKKFKKRR